MNPLVSVVIPTLNARTLLGNCLDGLRVQTYAPVEIIVVDNGSTDYSAEWVREKYPDVRVVTLQKNRGFAGGCNAGIAVARGAYIAVLNNDTSVHPTWIAELMRAIDGRPDVGMVASKMLFTFTPNVVNSTGICLDRTAIAWDRHGGWPVDPTEADVEIFGPSGGAALYRREVFDDVGTFDEDFFCYLEDVDLAFRARLAGWRCVYAANAEVLHHHSATAVESSPFKRFHLGRNKVWVVAKNYPAPHVLLYLPAILFYDLASVLSAVFFLRMGGAAFGSRMASLAGRLEGFRTISRALRKRRSIQKRRRVPVWRLLAQMDPIALPWSLYRRYAHILAPRKST